MEPARPARTSDPDRIRPYLSDESGSFHGRATELFLPTDTQRVAEVVRAANRAGTLLTVSGAGTSITGSRVPLHGGGVLSVERMVAVQGPHPAGFERVEAAGFTVLLDRHRRRAVLPPAISLLALDAILARFGLLYPPDPTETTAMIGGTVATNASGARSFYYGPTRSWVRRLKVVLPTGEVAELRRGDPQADGQVLVFHADGRPVRLPLPDLADYRMPQTKNAAGLFLRPDMEPIDLFIGCEGTLGIITEVEVALLDRPTSTLTVMAYFGSLDGALDLVDAAVSPVRPFNYLSLEYFDGRSLDFLRARFADIPGGVAAAVMFELTYAPADEHGPYPPSDMLARVEDELARRGAVLNWAVPGHRREDVRDFRHSLPEAVNEFVRTRTGKIGTDMAVPHEQLRRMMDAYERESGAADVPFLMFGHIGNGHIHLNYLPADAAGAGRARRAYSRLARLAVQLGGTVSAEHGVGKKAILDESGRAVPLLELSCGPRGLQIIAAIKSALDPNHILNVGNMVPPEMLG